MLMGLYCTELSIYISLITYNVAYLLMCLLAGYLYVFCVCVNMSFQIFCLFLIGLFVLLLSCNGFLNILQI